MDHIVSLLCPDGTGLDKLISWESAKRKLEALPGPKRGRIVQRYIPFSKEHSRFGERVQNILKANPEREMDMTILGATIDCLFTIFALDDVSMRGHAVSTAVWRGEVANVACPLNCALTGRFAVVNALLPNSSLLNRVAGAFLFLEASKLEALTKPQQVSQAAVLREGRGLVERFSSEHAGRTYEKSRFQAGNPVGVSGYQRSSY